MSRSPYHLGFCTQPDEARLDALPVHGTVPSWLDGELLRTGPGIFEIGPHSYHHWFDGLAVLRRFAFRNGRISYSNRVLQSRSYREAVTRGCIARGEYSTAPQLNPLQRLASYFRRRLTDNGNINVGELGRQLVAFAETSCAVVLIDRDTLAALGHYSYGERVKGQLSTAHPHFDFDRQCCYTYLLEFGAKSKYHVVRIDAASGERRVVATVPTDRPAYMHSFAMTERYVVLMEFPLVVNPLRLKFSGEPFIRNYRWRPERGTRFQVLDKDSGKLVRCVQGAPAFAFHHVNAFEMGDDLLLDVAAYPNPSVIDQFYLDHLRSSQPFTALANLTRFRITSTGDVRQEVLPLTSIELPRIAYARCAGRQYRYVYAVSTEVSGSFYDKLVKADLHTCTISSWHQADCYPGEPVFVPEPGALYEDSGAVLSVVLDARRGISFLLILDAAEFREVARAELPHVVTFGFHGNFFPAHA